MPIRWRLSLWFALILFLILAVFGLFFYAAFQRWLIAEVDGGLKVYLAQARADLPADLSDPIDYDIVAASLPRLNEFTAPGMYVELMDTDRRVVVKSPSLGESELPIPAGLVDEVFRGREGAATVSYEGNTRILIRATPVRLGGQTHLLGVAQSLASVDRALGSAGLAVLIGILVVMVFVLVLGVFLIRRALVPVRRVSAAARRIVSSSDLSQRVGYRGPRDEIGELATTFDRMIEHIDRLVKSQKSFVADASHELRGPLTVIRGNLDLLKRDISEEDRRESIRVVESEATRMSRVVGDLLVLAELDSGQPPQAETVSLLDILLDVHERAQRLAGNRQVVLGRREDLWVRGNSHRLEQALMNLVDNAIKYTDEGGVITLSLFRDGRWARLEVADTGIGISAEHLPHIFDRFYRVDRSRSRAGGGTGLGLAIVRGIVEQHDGKITVTSEPGRGSTFTIWLKL